MKKIFILFLVLLVSLILVDAHGSISEKGDHDCPMHRESSNEMHEEMHNDLEDEEMHEEMHNQLKKENSGWFSKLFKSMWYNMHNMF